MIFLNADLEHYYQLFHLISHLQTTSEEILLSFDRYFGLNAAICGLSIYLDCLIIICVFENDVWYPKIADLI